ncbi:Uncharacterized protein T4C_3993 [Trichinella pseudospiralis]|uniref:Integrase catalytic domain-containing protein n=2 Tax=Trichinella pseudospiralis TaxID=6337 RepID=A0A0V1IWW8_TRIPS|nr:Uncharacterized protein T4C_3993 [Trichinella pseudospiralis]
MFLTKLRTENNTSRKAGQAKPRGLNRPHAVMTNQLSEECGDVHSYTINKRGDIQESLASEGSKDNSDKEKSTDLMETKTGYFGHNRCGSSMERFKKQFLTAGSKRSWSETTIKERKCVLATDEVEFLGFRINARGIQHTQDKVKAILAAPRPTNQTELQTFLGLTRSKNGFGVNSAKELLRKLNRCYSRQACAVLSHVMSDDTETPVAYASKTLTATKRNYAQIDKEALAIVFRVKKFHQYLYEAQKQVVMDMLHQAHSGIMRIKALARSYEWWPRIDNYVEQMVQRYKPCEESRNAPERAPVHIWTIGKKLTNHVVVDSYSKWLEVRPVLTTSSALAISNLRHLFTTHGLPEALSDNATAFTSKEFQNFMLSNAIRHITITPYHPASNGQAEQMVQTIKKALQRIVKGYWNIHLARFLLSQHITLNSKIGLSPAELLMHRRARTLWDNLHPDRANISSNRQNIQQRNAENAKETRTYKNYSKEDKWIPSIVERQSGPVSYDTRTSEGERHRRHVDQLRIRVDTSKEKIQEKKDEEDKRKEGTERDLQKNEEQKTRK